MKNLRQTRRFCAAADDQFRNVAIKLKPVFVPNDSPPTAAAGSSPESYKSQRIAWLRQRASINTNADNVFSGHSSSSGSASQADPTNVRRTVDALRQGLQDHDCGIESYLGSHAGFSARYKSLYEDFCVTEILESGEVVELRRPKVTQNLKTLGDKDEFVTFTLKKKNRSTDECLQTMADCSGLDRAHFSAHGLKDRKAVTIQKVSADASVFTRVAAESMFKHPKWDPAIKIGDFEYSQEHCKVGGLLGNRFSLCLRDVSTRTSSASPSDSNTNTNILKPSEQSIANMVHSLTKTGFINFFGHQRFGTGSRSSHLFGVELLRGNYESAVLKFFEHNVKDALSATALAAYRSNDFATALRNTPPNRRFEHKILTYLAESSSKSSKPDYKGCIMALPRSSRLLYIRTYTSYIFNKLASFRAQLSPNKLLVGDLVYASEQTRNVHRKEYLDDDGNRVTTQTIDIRVRERKVKLPEKPPLTQLRIWSRARNNCFHWLLGFVAVPS